MVDQLHSDRDTIANLLLIVTGAHLRAEAADRPLAYDLGRSFNQIWKQSASNRDALVVPLVISDIWYLNSEELHDRPTISLGGPGVNALSAAWARQIPYAVLREEQMVIQLDPEFVDLRACIWGMDHALTTEALEIFKQKYGEGFLRAVATQVEPKIE